MFMPIVWTSIFILTVSFAKSANYLSQIICNCSFSMQLLVRTDLERIDFYKGPIVPLPKLRISSKVKKTYTKSQKTYTNKGGGVTVALLPGPCWFVHQREHYKQSHSGLAELVRS